MTYLNGVEWTVHALADAVRSGRLRAEEVVSAALARIEAYNLRLNAFVYIDHDQAINDARAVDRVVQGGGDPGCFAGVPIGIKDLHEQVRSMPTSDGSLLYKGTAPAACDTPHVALLRAAGAVIVGVSQAAGAVPL